MPSPRVLFSAIVLIFAVLLGAESRAGARALPTDAWFMYQYAPDHNAVFDEPRWNFSWHTDLGGKINGSLSIVAGTLFVESFDRSIYAIDPLNGQIKWRAPLSYVAMNTPLVYGGLVFAGTGADDHYTDTMGRLIGGRPAGDNIFAFDARTGALAWRAGTVGEDMPTAVVIPNGETQLFFANGDYHLHALNAMTGASTIETSIPGSDAMGSLVSADGLIFGTSVYGASDVIKKAYAARNPFALDTVCRTWAARPGDGQLLWIGAHGGCGLGTPTVADGQVFVEGEQFASTSSGMDARRTEVDALDERTGQLRWKYLSEAGTYDSAGSGLEDAAGVYLNGVLYDGLPYAREFAAFNGRSGKVIWRVKTVGHVKMSPLIDGDKVLFGDNAGLFYVVDRPTGKLLQTIKFPGVFTCSSPLIVGDTLFIANSDALYALRVSGLGKGLASLPGGDSQLPAKT